MSAGVAHLSAALVRAAIIHFRTRSVSPSPKAMPRQARITFRAKLSGHGAGEATILDVGAVAGRAYGEAGQKKKRKQTHDQSSFLDQLTRGYGAPPPPRPGFGSPEEPPPPPQMAGTHIPSLLQVSPLQPSPLQSTSLLTGFEQFPVEESHVPARWHASLAVQVFREPPHFPVVHLSSVVHGSLSSQEVPLGAFGFEQLPVAESHVPATWH